MPFKKYTHLRLRSKIQRFLLAFVLLGMLLNFSSCAKQAEKKIENQTLIKTWETFSENNDLTNRTRHFYNANRYETLRLTSSIDPTTNIETPTSKLEIRVSNDTVYRLFYLYKTNVSDYVLSSAYAYLYDANGYTLKQLRLTLSSPNLLPVISTITFNRKVMSKDVVEYSQSTLPDRKIFVNKSDKTVTIENYSGSTVRNRLVQYFQCFEGANFEKLPIIYNYQKEFGFGFLPLSREIYTDFENPSQNYEKNNTINKDSKGRVSEMILSTGVRNRFYY